MKWFDRKVDEFIQRIRDDPVRDRTKITVGDDPQNPTYWRWYVWPRNPYLNLYLHNFVRDDAHDLHDHRMMNVSFILQGAYMEERFMFRPVPGMRLPPTTQTFRPNYSFTFRLPATAHRVVLLKLRGQALPTWSLFLGFPHWRNWGFWCPGKDGHRAFWRQHESYAMSADPTGVDYGRKGRGCDD